jgi:hypothetical protein
MCYMLYQLILLDFAVVIVLVKHKVIRFLVSPSSLFDRPIYIEM